MKPVLLMIFTCLALTACSSDPGELSEQRSNCFGKLDAQNLSKKLIEVPQS